MLWIVGDELDVVIAHFGALDILDDYRHVAVVAELQQIDFAIDDRLDAVEDFVGNDVATLEQWVHGVADDMYSPVASWRIGY